MAHIQGTLPSVNTLICISCHISRVQPLLLVQISALIVGVSFHEIAIFTLHFIEVVVQSDMANGNGSASLTRWGRECNGRRNSSSQKWAHRAGEKIPACLCILNLLALLALWSFSVCSAVVWRFLILVVCVCVFLKKKETILYFGGNA